MNPISNDSFDAKLTDAGLEITEKSKGPLKMLFIFSGLAIAAIALSFPLVGIGGLFGRIVGPALFWGGLVIIAISAVAIFMKVVVQTNRDILFNTQTKELHLRGKVIPFDHISEVNFQIQELMGRQGCFVFLKVNGKKKSLFSTSVVTLDPSEIETLTEKVKELTGS